MRNFSQSPWLTHVESIFIKCNSHTPALALTGWFDGVALQMKNWLVLDSSFSLTNGTAYPDLILTCSPQRLWLIFGGKVKYGMSLAPSVSLKQSAVQVVSFLPPTIQLQICLRKQSKIQYITTEKKKEKKKENPPKKYQKHNQSYWRLNVCGYLVIKVLAPHISTAPSQQVPCVQLVSWKLRCNFLHSFRLGLTLQVKELIYTSSYRSEAIGLEKFIHLSSSMEWEKAYCRTA